MTPGVFQSTRKEFKSVSHHRILKPDAYWHNAEVTKWNCIWCRQKLKKLLLWCLEQNFLILYEICDERQSFRSTTCLTAWLKRCMTVSIKYSYFISFSRGHRTLNICVQFSNVRSCSTNIRTREHGAEKKIKEHPNIWMLMNIRKSNI